MNGDRNVDDEDRMSWLRDVKHTWFGDANLDGSFDSGDLVQVFDFGEYEDTIGINSGWAAGDWTGDGEFNSNDIVLAFEDGGYDKGPRPRVAAVPEPAGYATVVLALGAFMGHRSRPQRV